MVRSTLGMSAALTCVGAKGQGHRALSPSALRLMFSTLKVFAYCRLILALVCVASVFYGFSSAESDIACW